MLAKQSPANIKQNNLHVVLNTIIQHEPLSRADLVRLTHISKPTVSNLVDELIARNLVCEIGEGESRTGRKPILVKFNSTRRYFVAFNTGRDDYHIALSDLKGVIVDERNGEFHPSQTYHDRLQLLSTYISELLRNRGITSADLLKIHGAAPGVYVGKGQALKWSGIEIPETQDMQQFLEHTFHTPVLLNHSSKLALFGEKLAGKACDASHVVYIDLGHGLGGAFMFNREVYFGANDSAGEIGYMYSDPKEFEAYALTPYRRGALETIISGGALQQKGIALAQKQPATKILEFAGGVIGDITAKTIFDAAKQGDPQAYYILKESFAYFNMGLCNMINMLNPERIILGGGISKTGEFLLDFIINEIQDKVLIMPEFAISDLQNKATIIGAITYLIEHTDFLTELE